MAEPFEAEIRIKGVDEAVRDLREMEGQLGEVKEGMEGASGGASNMGQNITAAVVSVQAAYAAITKLVGAVKAAADEFERQAGILNRFNGDIAEAARRTNGLITELDLMTAQSKAAAAGLVLTADQFATVSVRAAEFAAATGQDATGALNTLIEAIATGRAGALQRLGVDLQGITDITDKQTSAIAQLTEGYEDAESSADTFAGRLTVLSNRLDDVQTEMIGAIEDSGLMDQAFDDLTSATRALIGEFEIFGSSDGPISDVEMFALTGAAIFAALAEEIESTAKMISAAMEIISDPTNIEAIARLDSLLANEVDFGDRVAANQQSGLGDLIGARTDRGVAANEASGGANTGRRRGRGGNRTEVDVATNTTKAKEELLTLIAQQEEAEQRLLDNQASKAEVAALLFQQEKDRLALMEQQTAEAAKQKQLIMEQREAEEERQATQRRANRINAGVEQGLTGIADIVKRTIELTEQSGMSRKEAFKTAMDEWLKQLALQETYKGIAATAEAIGNAIMNQPHAAAKGAEAGIHFGLAAIAGGASAAIPNAPSGGASSGAARPESPNPGAGSGGGGNVVINYNAPTAESQLGAVQVRLQRAAERRRGR